MTEHTPGPLTFHGNDAPPGLRGTITAEVKPWDESGRTTAIVALLPSSGGVVQESVAADGRRLVQCANAHDDLLKALEEIANSFTGVSQSYALQAGREIRVIVQPEDIDDLEATRLARQVAKKIEEGMQYPGQIKVTVIRETRAVDYAK